jgi:hypothetical protein
MELRDTNIMYKITNYLLNYALHFLKRNDYGLIPEEFNTLRHKAAPCFIPLVKWSEPLVSYQDLYDTNKHTIIWNSTQTMRYAVGASLMSIRYMNYQDYENLQHSVIAKAFDKFQVGILDDLIDRGDYDYQESKKLYRHVISSMTTPNVDSIAFQKELNELLNPGQHGISDLITEITTSFSTFFFEAPRVDDVIGIIKELDERLIEGQALTVLQKRKYLDLEKIRTSSENFYAPENGLKWYDKLANHISGGIRYNLIDIAYCNDDFDITHINNILKTWYFFDINMVYMNNIIDIETDLENEIYNLSLVDIKDGDISFVDRNDFDITTNDYEKHMIRNAEIANRALSYIKYDEEHWKYYLFITMMIPLVMMTDWLGKKDDMIELFLNNIS